MKYPKLVIEEAKNLKKHATKEEIERLDFENLRVFDSNQCIYGQTTGNCYSDRAVELIQKCARRVYKANSSPDVVKRKDLNGSPVKACRDYYWSPIEVFIAKARMSGNHLMNRRLIQFIKGEIKTL